MVALLLSTTQNIRSKASNEVIRSLVLPVFDVTHSVTAGSLDGMNSRVLAPALFFECVDGTFRQVMMMDLFC